MNIRHCLNQNERSQSDRTLKLFIYVNSKNVFASWFKKYLEVMNVGTLMGNPSSGSPNFATGSVVLDVTSLLNDEKTAIRNGPTKDRVLTLSESLCNNGKNSNINNSIRINNALISNNCKSTTHSCNLDTRVLFSHAAAPLLEKNILPQSSSSGSSSAASSTSFIMSPSPSITTSLIPSIFSPSLSELSGNQPVSSTLSSNNNSVAKHTNNRDILSPHDNKFNTQSNLCIIATSNRQNTDGHNPPCVLDTQTSLLEAHGPGLTGLNSNGLETLQSSDIQCQKGSLNNYHNSTKQTRFRDSGKSGLSTHTCSAVGRLVPEL